jgi:hypothetical protein
MKQALVNFKILYQGDVKMSHDFGYMAVGNSDCVCFFIDPVEKAYIEASLSDKNDCPIIYLARDDSSRYTEIVFPDHQGWEFHSGGSGKTIAVTLVRRAARVQVP